MNKITKTLLTLSVACIVFGFTPTEPKKKNTKLPVADAGNGGIKLPKDFGAVVVAQEAGKARHLAVNANGDVYVKLRTLKNGKGITILRDKNGDGRADETTYFGDFAGNGIVFGDGYLYASSNTDVYRYKLINGQPDETSKETIVKNLPEQRQHETKSLALDGKGNIYVSIGAPSNVCQVEDRKKGSLGQDPCPLLESYGGVWQFKANKANQTQTDGIRYATGIRNIVGMDWNKQSNELYAMQHGRDMLADYFPELYPAPSGEEMPSEEFLMVKKDSDFGWPYCHFDHVQDKKILNPEYGGDHKTVGRCDGKDRPILGFPGHWAPNGLLFYTGNQFPARYKNGAFICFHGSWNRTPKNHGGYNIAFVPMGADGKPSGKYEIFASDFAAMEFPNPGAAKSRPMGLAQGPDGSLYVSDSQKGKIWRVMYYGK